MMEVEITHTYSNLEDLRAVVDVVADIEKAHSLDCTLILKNADGCMSIDERLARYESIGNWVFNQSS